jgi:hypothetical protein
MTQSQGIESATVGCFRILLLALLEVLLILFLAGCAPIDNHIIFYGGEEWVVENRITLNPEQKSKEGSSIEAEIERRAIDWRKRDVRYDWHIEKKDDNTAYVVNAQGRGWQTLNEFVFDKQAVIQPTKNLGEISFSYNGKDVPSSLVWAASFFFFVPIGLFVHRKMSSTTSLFDSISVSVQGMV